jgi:hypothetical protein
MIKQSPSGTLPLSSPQWQQWLQELVATGNVLQSTDPTNPNFGKLAPANPQTGLLAYANGTDWNPGSGEGLYRWTGVAWKYIG